MATSSPVLATDEAISAVSTLKTQINSGLREQIEAVLATGEILTDPSQWNGPKAMEFEGLWPDVRTSLTNANTQLGEIADRVDQITAAIMAAGGN